VDQHHDSILENRLSDTFGASVPPKKEAKGSKPNPPQGRCSPAKKTEMVLARLGRYDIVYAMAESFKGGRWGGHGLYTWGTRKKLKNKKRVGKESV